MSFKRKPALKGKEIVLLWRSCLKGFRINGTLRKPFYARSEIWWRSNFIRVQLSRRTSWAWQSRRYSIEFSTAFCQKWICNWFGSLLNVSCLKIIENCHGDWEIGLSKEISGSYLAFDISWAPTPSLKIFEKKVWALGPWKWPTWKPRDFYSRTYSKTKGIQSCWNEFALDLRHFLYEWIYLVNRFLHKTYQPSSIVEWYR